MAIKDGNEHFTVQYAPDGVNFQIASITSLMPDAPGPFVPDAFTGTTDGRGITWGLCHNTLAGGGPETQHTVLMRFDCDLSLDDDNIWHLLTGLAMSKTIQRRTQRLLLPCTRAWSG